MTSKGKRPLLSAQSKIDAIRRVHDGESKASVARDIGVPESTLRGWCKNEEKILILSRQSTPETSDVEPDCKKIKCNPQSSLDTTPLTGLNLSMSNLNHTPNSALDNLVQTSSIGGYDSSKISPFNIMTSKTPIISSKRDSKRASAMSERERTRAELSRLSAELGLDRPEFGLLNLTKRDQGVNMSMLATSPLTNLNHLSGGTSHVASLGASFQDIAAKVWNQFNQNAALTSHNLNQQQKPHKRKSPTKEPLITSSTLNQLSAMQQQKKDSMTPTSTTNNVNNPLMNLSEDTMWYWMRRQQELLQLAQAQQLSSPTASSSITDMSALKDDQLSGSWLWKWYKQCYGLATAQNLANDKNNTSASPMFNGHSNNILLQQLTKEGTKFETANETVKEVNPDSSNISQSNNNNNSNVNNNGQTNVSLIENQEQTQNNTNSVDKSNNNVNNNNSVSNNNSVNNNLSNNTNQNTKVRAVLDDILTNNCNLLNNKNDKDDNENEANPPSLLEAIECGQKLLRWMESCSDPAVTVTHIIQFKYLLNNIKQSAERSKNSNADSTSEKINRRK